MEEVLHNPSASQLVYENIKGKEYNENHRASPLIENMMNDIKARRNSVGQIVNAMESSVNSNPSSIQNTPIGSPTISPAKYLRGRKVGMSTESTVNEEMDRQVRGIFEED